MGTHDINVHIYPYLKIKMDKKNGHKIYTKAQNACSKENNFSFSTSTKFLPFTEFSSTERNKKPFSRRETKKKKKKENVKTWMEPERVPFEYSWNGHVNDDRRSKNSIRKNWTKIRITGGARFFSLVISRILSWRGFQQSGSTLTGLVL